MIIAPEYGLRIVGTIHVVQFMSLAAIFHFILLVVFRNVRK